MVPDRSPIVRPAPIVPWRLPQPKLVPGAHRFRTAGATVGLVVALIAIVLAVKGPFPTGFGWVGTGASWLAGTILAGALGGWLLGPETWRARTLLDWGRLVTRLGLAAVGIGGVTVGLAMGLEVAATTHIPLLLQLSVGLAYGLLFAVIGIPTFGMYVLPITLAAGLVWAIVIRLLRPRLEAVALPAGGAA
jgi:hypothetical protein